jgi:DNA repair protein RecN (Recombination protein N)
LKWLFLQKNFMLKRLFIKNYILIDQLEIQPSSGFNAITGQTGAGKSILLGALGLLLGERLENKTTNDDKCVIEGEFEYDGLQDLLLENELDVEPTLTLRREISSQGKSRAFVNDSPVTLEVLRKISSQLIDIHSQYDTLKLSSSSYQLSVLDALAQNQALLQNYKTAFEAFGKAQKAHNHLQTLQKQILEEQHIHQTQLSELEKLKLSESNFASAESELLRLENAELIKTKLTSCVDWLDGEGQAALSLLKAVLQNLNSISSFSPEYEQLAERINSVRLELDDIATELSRQSESLYYNPEEIAKLRAKIDAVNSLLLKYRMVEVGQLIDLHKALKEKTQRAEGFALELQESEKTLKASQSAMLQAAQQLSESRKAVVENFAASLLEWLAVLGMPQARFEVRISPCEPTKNGCDEVCFLFSANKGQKLDEMGKVASGGEFSRLMLVIKYLLAKKSQLPCLIFDEIDTGISGEITLKVASLIREIAQVHQVFVITHQPLMAAGARAHYLVFKQDSEQKTTAHVKLLNSEERLFELATMIAGSNPPPSALQSAAEIIKQAQ